MQLLLFVNDVSVNWHNYLGKKFAIILQSCKFTCPIAQQFHNISLHNISQTLMCI